MGLLISGHVHGVLPWLAHCDITMAIPGHSNVMPHLKRWWRVVWWERGGAGLHGILPWLAHWDFTMTIPWNASGTSH